MQNCIDLVSLLQEEEKGQIRGVRLYGKIISQVERPASLGDSVSLSGSGCFYCFKTLAIDFGSSSVKSKLGDRYDYTFLVNGDICVYADKGLPVSWRAIEGNIRLSKGSNLPLVGMFAFGKTANGFTLYPYTVSDLYLSSIQNPIVREYVDASTRGTSLNPTLYGEVATMTRFVATASDILTTPDVTVPKEEPLISQQTKLKPADISKPVEFATPPPAVLGNSDENTASMMARIDEIAKASLKLQNKYEDFKDRGTTRETNACFTAATTLVDTALARRNSYINEDLTLKYERYDVDDFELCLSLFNKITEHYNEIGGTSGKNLVERYLRSALSKTGISLTREEKSWVLNNISSCLESSIDGSSLDFKSKSGASATKKGIKRIRSLFSSPEWVYAGFVAIALGLKFSDLVDTSVICDRYGLSFTKIVNDNPMLLGYFNQNLTIETLTRLSFAFVNQATDQTAMQMLKVWKYVSSRNPDSTIMPEKSCQYSITGFKITLKQWENLRGTNTIFSQETEGVLQRFFGKFCYLGNQDFCWHMSSDKRYYTEFVSGVYLHTGLEEAIRNGLLVKFSTESKGAFYADTLVLNSEIRVMQSIQYRNAEVSKHQRYYKKEEIDTLIAQFEEQKGFKLEEQQRKAVHLINNRVFAIAGVAGGGKTTVAECIAYVLENLNDDIEIAYAAPTGKAAKRLQEVVKKPVRTLASLFMIDSYSNSLEEESRGTDIGADVLIVDEMSMVTLSVMKRIMQLPHTVQIVLIGDPNQLPPIGRGLPFKDVLRYIPTVNLAITKRSAEHSGISKNAQVICKESEEVGKFSPLKQYNDCQLIPCQEKYISDVCSLICDYHLGRVDEQTFKTKVSSYTNERITPIDLANLSPDDIQIVSPLTKSNYSWGTQNINGLVRHSFNPDGHTLGSFQHKIGSDIRETFEVGDRVVHCDNDYNRQWYSSYSNGVLKAMSGSGVVNGDVGTVAAIIKASDMTFDYTDTESSDDFDAPDGLRDDSIFNGENDYFVVVKFFDFTLRQDFYILYQATLDSYSADGSAKVFRSTDLSQIQLFYCGTVHKMQGSQSRLVLVLLGNVSYGHFITRNMMYTAITRASEGVYLIGSVSNVEGSQMFKARQEEATKSIQTPVKYFIERK